MLLIKVMRELHGERQLGFGFLLWAGALSVGGAGRWCRAGADTENIFVTRKTAKTRKTQPNRKSSRVHRESD